MVSVNLVKAINFFLQAMESKNNNKRYKLQQKIRAVEKYLKKKHRNMKLLENLKLTKRQFLDGFKTKKN